MRLYCKRRRGKTIGGPMNESKSYFSVAKNIEDTFKKYPHHRPLFEAAWQDYLKEGSISTYLAPSEGEVNQHTNDVARNYSRAIYLHHYGIPIAEHRYASDVVSFLRRELVELLDAREMQDYDFSKDFPQKTPIILGKMAAAVICDEEAAIFKHSLNTPRENQRGIA